MLLTQRSLVVAWCGEQAQLMKDNGDVHTVNSETLGAHEEVNGCLPLPRQEQQLEVHVGLFFGTVVMLP